MPCAVILTALQVEFLAVRVYLTNPKEITHPQGTVYEQGQFSANGQTWDVGIVEIGAGNPGAALEAERAIAYFKPDVVLFVGVAGGIKDVALGDVVASTKVYGYESGKAEETFRPRPEVGLSAYGLEQRARAEARKADWLQRLSAVPSLTPRVFVAPIAAGEKVVASTESEVFQFLRSNYGDAVAVEMEGFGFLDAARANQQVSALVIRGISDLINQKAEVDKQGYQEISARHASAFAFEMLAKYRYRNPNPIIDLSILLEKLSQSFKAFSKAFLNFAMRIISVFQNEKPSNIPVVISVSLIFSLTIFSHLRQEKISKIEDILDSEMNQGLEHSIRAGKLVQSPLLRIWRDPVLVSKVALQLRLSIENTYEINRLLANAEITSIDVSPDGNLFAIGKIDGNIEIWEASGTNLIGAKLRGSVRSVDFSSDGKMLVSSNDYGKIRAWNVIDGKGLDPKAMSLDSGSVKEVQAQFAGDDDNRVIVIADFCNSGVNCAGNITLFDSKGQRLSSVTAHTEGIKSISLSSNEKNIISIGKNGNAKFWRIEDKVLELDDRLPKNNDLDDLTNADFSQSSENFIAFGNIYGKVYIWDGSNEQIFSCSDERSNSNKAINGIKFSRDDKTLVTFMSGSDSMHVWQVEKGACFLIKEVSGHTSIIRDIDVSPDNHIISGGDDKTIRIWDINSTLGGDRTNSRITSVDFSSDSSHLVVAYENGEVDLFHIDKNGNLKNLTSAPCKVLDRSISGIKFAPNSDSIIISTDSPIGSGSEPSDNDERYIHVEKIEDFWHSGTCNTINSPEILSNHPGHGDGIQAISVSSNRQILVSASWDNTIRLWDLDKDELLGTISKACDPQSVDISPNNQIVALGNTHGEVKIWRVNASTDSSSTDEDDCSADGALLTLAGHNGRVYSVSFSPDGKTLLTLDSEGVLRLWQTSKGKLLLERDIGEEFSMVYFNSDKNNPILFVSASDTFDLWNLNLERALKEGCGRIQDYLKNANQGDLCSGYLD